MDKSHIGCPKIKHQKHINILEKMPQKPSVIAKQSIECQQNGFPVLTCYGLPLISERALIHMMDGQNITYVRI